MLLAVHLQEHYVLIRLSADQLMTFFFSHQPFIAPQNHNVVMVEGSVFIHRMFIVLPHHIKKTG